MSADTLTRDDLLEVAEALDAARGLFGHELTERARALLWAAIAEPGEETWEAAHGLLVTERTTLWQAVCWWTEYNVVVKPLAGPWPRTPTGDQVRMGLVGATDVRSD